jgi:hypothetical protein
METYLIFSVGKTEYLSNIEMSLLLELEGRDSSVVIAIRLRARRERSRGSIPGSRK